MITSSLDCHKAQDSQYHLVCCVYAVYSLLLLLTWTGFVFFSAEGFHPWLSPTTTSCWRAGCRPQRGRFDFYIQMQTLLSLAAFKMQGKHVVYRPKLSKGSGTVVLPCFNPSFSGPGIAVLLRQDVFRNVSKAVKTCTRVHIYNWGPKHDWELFFSLCKVSEREARDVCYKLMGAFQLEIFCDFINCQKCS